MRVFLTGATGVIGRELLPLLIERGHEVTAMTRRDEEVPRLSSAGAEVVVADALDAEELRSALVDSRSECVLHELTRLPKAFDAERLSEQLAENDRVRTEGTRNLVAAAEAAGAGKIVAQSIAFGYAPEGSMVKDEKERLFVDAPEPWGRSVRAIEELENRVLGARNAEGVALRYGHLYGPGTLYAPEGQMGGGVLAGAIPIAGDGDGVFSFVHLEDLASATVAAIEGWPGGIYNVCDDEPAPAREWLPRYAESLGAEDPARAPAEAVREAAGWFTYHQMTEMRGASNRRAREQGWSLSYPSWRKGFAEALG